MAERDIPRFVVTITDTLTDVQLSAGADSIRDFRKPLPTDQRKPGIRCELDLMFKHFVEDLEASDG